MKKDLGVIFGLFIIVFLLLVFGGGSTSFVFLGSGNEASNQAKTSGTFFLRVKTLEIQSELASTDKLRKKGLGGRESLPINSGVLFVFDSTGNYIFWMKDVKFPVDIIWIDQDKKIVHITENVPIEPDVKDNDLVRYSSPVSAKYVLEINAGLSRLNDLHVGDLVEFSLN